MRIAVVQMQSALYRSAENLARTVDLLNAIDEADLAILPELSISGYGLDRAELETCAETPLGPTFQAWQAVAAARNMVIAGGFCERDGDRLYNSAMLIGPSGLLGHYRKLHLFDREKLVFSPGDRGLEVFDTAIGKIGLCVCYDLRFVEVVRSLALRGAQVIAVPTAWVGGFDKNPRDAMGYIGQARGAVVQANLSQVFIACASQAGAREDIRFLGSSLVADPFGEILLEPMGEDEQRIGIVEADMARLETAQRRSDLIRPREDRRTDTYGILTGGRSY